MKKARIEQGDTVKLREEYFKVHIGPKEWEARARSKHIVTRYIKGDLVALLQCGNWVEMYLVNDLVLVKKSKKNQLKRIGKLVLKYVGLIILGWIVMFLIGM